MRKQNSPPFWMRTGQQAAAPGMTLAAPGVPTGPVVGPPGYSPWNFRYSWPWNYPGVPMRPPSPRFPCLDAYPPLRDEFWRYMNDKSIPARVLYSVADYLARAGCSNESAVMAGEAERRSRFGWLPPWFQRRLDSPWFRPGPPVEYNPWLGTTQPYEIQQQGPYTVFVEPRPTVAGMRTQTGACGPSGCPGGVCPIR